MPVWNPQTIKIIPKEKLSNQICPDYKTNRDKDGAETDDNQSLPQPITAPTNDCPNQWLSQPITAPTNHCPNQSLPQPITAPTNHCPNQWLSQLETHLCEREPRPGTIKDTLQSGAQHKCHLKGFIQQQMEKGAETHSQTSGRAWRVLWKSWGIELCQPEGSRRLTESTNLGPRELTDTEPPIKEHAGADTSHDPHLQQIDVQLGLHLGPLTIGESLSLTLLPTIGSLFSIWITWLSLSERGYALSCWD